MFSKYQRYFKTALIKHKITEQFPQLHDHLNRLEQHFHHTLALLRTHFLTAKWKTKSLDEVPWCVLFGRVDSGKTSLLMRSELPFVMKKIRTNERAHSSSQFEFWASEHACFIDVPGIYLERTEPLSGVSYFQFLVNLVCSEKENVKWVYALSVDDLCSKDGMIRFVDHIQTLLSVWRQRSSKPLPLTLMITKCDRIPGFVEFFSENNPEENKASLGVSLDASLDGKTIGEQFEEAFTQLIRGLNRQLIMRLHRARGLDSRGLIKDFPIQIEKLHHLLVPYLHYLSGCAKLSVLGVYLSSAEQCVVSQLSSDRNKMLEHAGSVPIRLLFDNEIKNESYFIKTVFSSILAKSPERKPMDVREFLKWFGVVSLACLFGYLVWF